MDVAMKCAQCGEEIKEHSVKWKGRLYCCEACAFEASKKIGSICGTQEGVEVSLRYYKKSVIKDS